MERRTRGTFDRLAEQDGAVVAYPNALGDERHWNDGWPVGPPGAAQTDDLGFLSALIDSAVAEFGVDRKRVYAAGLSNGACMVYRLACERPELVAAVAPVSGGMVPPVAQACARGAPVSIIGMHGTDDPIIVLGQPIRDGITAWAKRDGCAPQPVSTRLADTDPGDGTQTGVDLFEPCTANTAVAFYTIEGGGHAWPGGDEPWRFALRRGHTSRDFDAGTVIWDFFQKHPRP
jgi:polyhydroxybutyrate depolymerase